ncbi:MAG: TIGR00730 family Rossman fold protein [Bacteroidetes bacterium]|nr:TIGR00730 family Rossman fold protein [Bacteroidota bacterium]MCW5895695.1 TIGR00730 family Rossman fold protein [Bacteroidota bacterium]
MNSICVFCGSSPGANGAYARAAETLGALLARERITLIFGGGKVGLMGHIADAVLSNGGKAVGVIPEALKKKEVAHDSLTELHVVDDMHIRKATMYDLADAFVALPGGTGTLDELFEVITWNQLGYLTKPVGLLNVGGYFDALTDFLRHTVVERFVKAEHLNLLHVEENVEVLLSRLKAPRVSFTDKWMDR